MSEKGLQLIKEFHEKLRADPVRLKAFMRSVMGPPKRTLEGKEKNDIILLLALMEPFEQSNNQHCWTDCYRIGEKIYQVTTFPDAEVIVDLMLPDDLS